VLLIDATNLACIAARHAASPGLPLRSCVSAWLDYLTALTRATHAVCAFDNKGAGGQGVRGDALPGYLAARHRRAGARGPPAAAATAAAAAHARPSSYEQLRAAVEGHGALALLADPGYEADDLLGCLVEALAAQRPGARAAVASGDSDMQQLIGGGVAWLQLLDGASAAHPLGVRWHDLRAFQHAFGFRPELYPDYLALAGDYRQNAPGSGPARAPLP
jgi:5'-3' exonuclease